MVLISGLLIGIGLCAAFAFIWCLVDFQCVIVSGESMSPTLRNQEICLGDRKFNLKRGDIITCFTGSKKASRFMKYNPWTRKKNYVKRVIGLPGDTIEIRKGRIFINGLQLHEDYITCFSRDNYPSKVIPKGYVFVLGDNRNHSADSRQPSIGLIRIENIMSKIFMRVFPTDKYEML